MRDLLWKRNSSLTIALRGDNIGLKSSNIGSDGSEKSNIRIVFLIEKTTGSFANTATIIVSNLSDDTLALFEDEKDNIVVILEVGYGNEIDTLWTGNVTNSIPKKSGTEKILQIESGDGDKALRDAVLDKSYKAGVNIKDIANDAIASLKEAGAVAVGTITDLKDQFINNGMTAEGLAKDTLDKIVAKQDLEWSIQDNEIQIYPKNGSTGDQVTLLSPKTGLIGSPEKKGKGVNFTALIKSTRIRPGRLVKVEAENFDAFVKIRKAKYVGDTHGNEWYVICEADII